ncbi:MAG: hypothetical protein ACK4KW_13685 [Gemmobacter sp.]
MRAVAILLALALPAAAETPGAGALRLELNRLDAEGAACRLTFVAENGWAPLSSLVIETVLFDRGGRVAALTLFDFGELPQGRRRVRQFDVAGTDCGSIGQVLVNGVATCTGPGAERAACAAALSVAGSAEGVEVAQ